MKLRIRNKNEKILVKNVFLVFIGDFEKMIEDEDDNIACIFACIHRKLQVVCKMFKLFIQFF